MNIPNLNNLIGAYECWNSPYIPYSRINKCENCPYGYGYYDDSGDHPFWRCNDDKWEDDAYFYLKLYQYVIEKEQNNEKAKM